MKIFFKQLICCLIGHTYILQQFKFNDLGVNAHRLYHCKRCGTFLEIPVLFDTNSGLSND